MKRFARTNSIQWTLLLAIGGVAACSSGQPGNGGDGDGTGSTGNLTDGSGGAFGSSSSGGSNGTGSGSGSNTGSGGNSNVGNSGGAGPAGGATGSGSGGGGDSGEGSGGSTNASGGVSNDGPPAGPEGTVPNDPYPDNKVNVTKDNWRDGLISPTLESEHHNQPSIINGYLQLTGNSRFSIYDISDPTQPKQLSHQLSPDDCTACGEAEGHQVSYAKYGDTFYSVTIQGKGVDIWDITDVRTPKLVKTVHIDGINYGDFTDAVWGVAWQGANIFVGATNRGLHVIDANDPQNAELTGHLANLGGVSAGPLFPVGNVLVVTTPKNNSGIATVDISDPENPILLKALSPGQESYIGGFYRHHAYLLNPIRVYDVLSNPADIKLVSGNRPGGYFEYMSFHDELMFCGRIRPEPGATIIDVADTGNYKFVKDVYGRRDLQENDDQFTVAVGNLLILSDDQLSPATNKYAGTVIAAYDTDPDTAPPRVDTVMPKDGATSQPITSRVGLTFTDDIELATVDHRSFIIREANGTEVPGKWSVSMSLLHFDPDGEFKPATSYEVVLPAGGVKDYVGNGIAAEFKSTFTTK